MSVQIAILSLYLLSLFAILSGALARRLIPLLLVIGIIFYVVCLFFVEIEIFDHVNYLHFFENKLVFQEPLYRTLSQSLGYFLSPQELFWVVPAVFLSLPLFICLRKNISYVYFGLFLIFFKNCIVGFINIRFFLAQMIFATFFLTFRSRLLRLSAGFVHFAFMPIGAFPKFGRRRNVLQFLLVAGLFLTIFFIARINDFYLLGLDYSRYSSAIGTARISFTTLLAPLFLYVISSTSKFKRNERYSIGIILIFGLLSKFVLDIDPASRIYQATIDLALLYHVEKVLSSANRVLLLLFIAASSSLFYFGVISRLG